MWRDYIQPISTITALFLSTLALVLAQFPVGSRSAKRAYVAVVMIVNLIAAGAVIYSQYYTVTKTKSEAAQRRDTREKIGMFIDQGNALLARLRDPNSPIADADADKWASEVEDYLKETLGQSYVLDLEVRQTCHWANRLRLAGAN
jgi:hypothetical protein